LRNSRQHVFRRLRNWVALQELNLPKASDADASPTPSVRSQAIPQPSKHFFSTLPVMGPELKPPGKPVSISAHGQVHLGRAANHARSVEELYQALATEISSLKDREKFCAPDRSKLTV
jgi:hypothetical protein